MPLSPGTRLGPYEILAPLGAGGMGEVYRARDSRLAREVAIKVLPQHLAATAEVRARFEREARAVSSLNHPNICTLHDVGHENGVDYLVMELIEGETLAERLHRGPLPIDETLRVGIQVADALDRAHRGGLVHRDLKPGNIMLTKSGAKILDFGLARVTGLSATNSDLSTSPTVTRALTAEGSIVGTFQYMAPEVLEGKEADARSDLWALGAILYEMATGRRAFEGRSQASLIGAIMNSEPVPLSQITPSPAAGPVPATAALDRLVRACLAKDPDQRVQTAHDVKLQLQWIQEGGSQAGLPMPAVTPRRRGREWIAWATAGGLALLLVAAILVLGPGRRDHAETTDFTVDPPPEVATFEWPCISPDGRTLAFMGRDSAGTVSIWVRPLGAFTPIRLGGTEGAAYPFWSPDSRELAFFRQGKLLRIRADGGPAQLVCEAHGADGSWGRSGVILFDGSAADSIQQVSAAGGLPSPATAIDRKSGEVFHGWPWFLPDGRHFIYLAGSSKSGVQYFLRVGSIDHDKPRDLGPIETRVIYAAPGYLLFLTGSTLMARRFDPASLHFAGDPFPLTDQAIGGQDRAQISASSSGTIAYLTNPLGDRRVLGFVDRAGRDLGAIGPPAGYCDPALSPDGRRVACGIVDPQTHRQDIWVIDLVRKVSSRVTFGAEDEVWPTWSPDGSQIAYAVGGGGGFGTAVQPAGGVGNATLLHKPQTAEGPLDWWGANIMIDDFDGGVPNLFVLKADSSRAFTPYVRSSFTVTGGRFSPNGRFVAYESNESGRREIYVQTFPPSGGKWQISSSGGTQATWRRDGKELYFRSPNQELMAVPVSTEVTFQAGQPVVLFRRVLAQGPVFRDSYCPSADGQKFLIQTQASEHAEAAINVSINWWKAFEKK